MRQSGTKDLSRLTVENGRTITDGDFACALADYTDGFSSGPPCENCGDPMPTAPFTGARLCEDCA